MHSNLYSHWQVVASFSFALYHSIELDHWSANCHLCLLKSHISETRFLSVYRWRRNGNPTVLGLLESCSLYHCMCHFSIWWNMSITYVLFYFLTTTWQKTRLLSKKCRHFVMCYENSFMTHGGLCGTARYLLFLNEYTKITAQQFAYHTYEMMHSTLHMRVQQQLWCCTSAFFVLSFISYFSVLFHLGTLLWMVPASSFKSSWPVQ